MYQTLCTKVITTAAMVAVEFRTSDTCNGAQTASLRSAQVPAPPSLELSITANTVTLGNTVCSPA